MRFLSISGVIVEVRVMRSSAPRRECDLFVSRASGQTCSGTFMGTEVERAFHRGGPIRSCEVVPCVPRSGIGLGPVELAAGHGPIFAPALTGTIHISSAGVNAH
jgi:hypothetical protein